MANSKAEPKARNGNHATFHEALVAYKNLSPDEARRIRAAACVYLPGTQFDQPSDLIHEALYFVLEGRRNWPKEIDFPIFLWETMRSIANNARNKLENKWEAVALEDAGDEYHSRPGENPFTLPSAEETASANQERNFARRIVNAAEIILEASDPRASAVLNAMLCELLPAEISLSLGIDLAQFYAAKKRVLRTLAASATL